MSSLVLIPSIQDGAMGHLPYQGDAFFLQNQNLFSSSTV